MADLDLETLSRQVILVSKEVGTFLRKEAQVFDVSKIEHKGINDLVSYVDREAEKKLVKRLQELIPDCGFYTEEDDQNKTITEKEFHWIIDPLDGTTNFMHSIPIFATSIALMQEDELVLGVVYEVNRDECFYAWKGGGAYCNQKPIQVSGINNLSNALLATGFPYRDFDQAPVYLNIINDMMRHSHGLRRMGSAAVDLCYVAIGRFEGFFEYNLNAWDVAAGALIVQEAGGTVSTFTGGNDYLFGREMVAACGIHPQMIELIGRHWK